MLVSDNLFALSTCWSVKCSEIRPKTEIPAKGSSGQVAPTAGEWRSGRGWGRQSTAMFWSWLRAASATQLQVLLRWVWDETGKKVSIVCRSCGLILFILFFCFFCDYWNIKGGNVTSSGNCQEMESCIVQAHTCHNSLSKTILQGTLETRRCHGQQRKCWMDNITEWTVLPVPELLTKASCRKDWKRISAKSSIMSPLWPSRPWVWTDGTEHDCCLPLLYPPLHLHSVTNTMYISVSLTL